LKGVYNDEYRQLLNSVIHETILGAIPHEYPVLPKTQIGSSIWTEEEKDLFFSALSRLGRHDSRGIALRIGTKSQLEVEEYIQLLRQGMKDRLDLRQLDLTELPAAFEISAECCDHLERAGDAVASRQELTEAKAEEDKHGELWLLTTDIATDIERQLRDLGEQSIAETLPAAKLLDLKNWLELPQRIFMNSGGSQEDSNWHSIAEPDETPALRATAFEDFHNLAVSITKRLMSTAMFCAMSRRRATQTMGVKHAEVVLDDVIAAVKILGLAENSLEFWIGCARRHSLNVVDDDDSRSDVDLTYDEVEAALRQTRRSRSRSRSRSRLPRSARSSASVGAGTDRDTAADSTAESLDTDDDSHDDEELYLLSSSGPEQDELADLSDASNRHTRAERERARRAEELSNALRAQDAYLEAHDNEASQMEENRLRILLRQSSPLDIKPEPLEAPDLLKQLKFEPRVADWKENFEYWSPWETFGTPVPEESFAENRKKMTRKAKRRMREESSGLGLSDDGEISSDAVVEVMDTLPSVEQVEETTPDALADVQMEDKTNENIYSASHSEESPRSQSQMSDDAFSSRPPQRAHRARSEEDIAIGSDYED
jgi:hypothetical protein